MEQGIKDAMKWINGELQDNPEANVNLLIDRASQQFNLTPEPSRMLAISAIVAPPEEGGGMEIMVYPR